MSLNKVILIGNLGKDPEVRYMPNGDPVCNFSIATSENWTDKNTGNRVERTEWHNIVLYRRLAEVAGQYLRKGSQVYIEGKIQSRKYTDKNGIERLAYEIIGSEMQMLGSRQAGGTHYEEYQAPSKPSYTPPPAYEAEQAAPPAAPKQRPAPANTAPVQPVQLVDDIDNDIPF